jgi:eukaryotic-like serine/threonine-protein kinase
MGNANQQSLFNPGDAIAGRYEVLSSLGCGGMGEVLRVQDKVLDDEILALKILYPQRAKDQRLVARFRNEVILARRLAHPNIVRLYDFGDAGQGCYYITMEMIEGVSLGSKLGPNKAERLPFPELLQVLYQICTALHYAHSQNVIHRDLKPDNILLAKGNLVKLTDFGIARSTVEDKGLTGTSEMVGTPYYMAPEQFRGERPDGRVDIYGLGILAFEMATGKRPFNHDSTVGLQLLHLTNSLPKIADKESGIPSWFEEFVEICAEKEAKDRYQSMAEAAEVLFDHMTGMGIPQCVLGQGFCPALRKQKLNGATRSGLFRLFS